VIYLLAVVSAVLTSVFWRVYIRATDRSNANQAFLGDYGLLLIGTLIQQLWVTHGDDVRILLLYDTVAAATTWGINRWTRATK